MVAPQSDWVGSLALVGASPFGARCKPPKTGFSRVVTDSLRRTVALEEISRPCSR
jgi:hypothetical protein